jgi:hypothetical protein
MKISDTAMHEAISHRRRPEAGSTPALCTKSDRERTLPFPDAKSIDEAFAAFDETHPEVYRLFRDLAESLWNAGKRRGSARDIWGRIRWEYDTGGRSGDFALNNNFTALYARKLAAEDERFATFFEFRARKAAT